MSRDFQMTREPDRSEECRLRTALATVTAQRDALQAVIDDSGLQDAEHWRVHAEAAEIECSNLRKQRDAALADVERLTRDVIHLRDLAALAKSELAAVTPHPNRASVDPEAWAGALPKDADRACLRAAFSYVEDMLITTDDPSSTLAQPTPPDAPEQTKEDREHYEAFYYPDALPPPPGPEATPPTNRPGRCPECNVPLKSDYDPDQGPYWQCPECGECFSFSEATPPAEGVGERETATCPKCSHYRGTCICVFLDSLREHVICLAKAEAIIAAQREAIRGLVNERGAIIYTEQRGDRKVWLIHEDDEPDPSKREYSSLMEAVIYIANLPAPAAEQVRLACAAMAGAPESGGKT